MELRITCVIVTALLAACSSETSGVAGTSLLLTVQHNPVAAETIATDDARGTTFTFGQVSAGIRHIELDLNQDTSCDDLADFDFRGPARCEGNKVRIEGPFVVDLNDGTSTPSLEGLTIPAMTYKRVDVRFDDTKDDEGLVDDGDPLLDHTMHATGSFDLDGDDTAFELLLKFNEDARFESPGGVTVGEGASEMLLWLDVGVWFEQLSITECIEDGDLEVKDGLLTMDDQRSGCSDIENDLKDVIKKSGQLK